MPKYGQYNVPKSDTMVNFSIGQPNNLNLPIEWFQSTCAKMSKDFFGTDENEQFKYNLKSITNSLELDEHKELLQYGAIEGYDDIRVKMSQWLTEKYYLHLKNKDLNIKHQINPKDIFMTNGNTGALHFLISKYTESTDYIIVENPSYFIAINMFKEYGLNIEGVNMDLDGVNLYDLENKIKELNENSDTKQTVLFYYMIPSYHNPTGITTTHEKRKKIADLCKKYDNLYIIADEVYHFLSWNEKCDYYPMADYHPKIVSLGSFSKILAPALRVGWIYQNTELKNYCDAYGIVKGTSGLNTSAVLDSCGGINPIGFKFIEYALEKSDESETNSLRHIDKIIKTNLEKLSAGCNIMLEYLSQFNNIIYTKPKGGYFIWIEFKSIRNTSDFLKLCEQNKVTFHPGIKFSTDSSYTNCIRLSFSYYDTDDLIIGLERLMDSVIKYNSINIMLNGSTGKLGSLIKKEIMNNKDFNYVGDIKRNLNKTDFDGLISHNSVIIDVSSNEGTYNLLSFLMKEKIFLPLIIGTTGLTEITSKLIEMYSKICQVAHITNFSEGIPLFKKFAKLANELNVEWKFMMTDVQNTHKENTPSETVKIINDGIIRDVPINSIRIDKVINEHSLELTNGSEVLKLTHSIINQNTFVKGCMNYIYWILSKSNGFYNCIDNDIDSIIYNNINDKIILVNLSKDLPQVLLIHIVKNFTNKLKDVTKIIFLKHIKDDKYQYQIYGKTGKTFDLINYCGYSLLAAVNYIRENDEHSSGKLSIDNTQYAYTSSDKFCMVKLPFASYLESKGIDNHINEVVNQMTNLILFGVSRYICNNVIYLLLEVKDNIFDSDMLDTICTIINSEQEQNKKFNMIFINSNFHTTDNKNIINLRFFDTESNEVSDNGIGCAIAFEYYLYHFIKKYDISHHITFKLVNDEIIKLSYNSGEMFIYDECFN